MCPPKRKQQDQHHWGAFVIKTFLFCFLVFTSECEGKILTKGGFCAPQRECVPPQKATGPTPLGCICDQDLFVLFLSSPPNVRAKFVPKEVFVPPSENVSPSKNRAPKESIRTEATGVHFLRRLLFFFLVFPPNVRAKSASKEVFVLPKRKSCPKRKQQDRRHGDAFVINTFFWSSFLNIFFCPTKIFYAPLLPTHYSGAESASMNGSEIRLKIVFLEDLSITSVSTICLGLGEDLFLFCLEITAFPKLFAK